MRTTARLSLPLPEELPTLLGMESAPPAGNLGHSTAFKPPLQFLSEMNSADRERHTDKGAWGATAVPLRDRGGRGGRRDDQGIPQGIKARGEGGSLHTGAWLL